MPAMTPGPKPDGWAQEKAPGRKHPRALAAFDFDGTLTVCDSFTAFLRWRSRGLGEALGLLRMAPTAAAYIGSRDRGRLKSAAVRAFLQGSPREALERQAERFAAVASGRLLRPDALAAWSSHKARGERLVIVTASPEEIVRPFARRLGADTLIGSRLLWTAQDRVGAGLDGPNCRGPEKVRRLREAFGADVAPDDAYGDTDGDREMLALARRGHMRAFRDKP